MEGLKKIKPRFCSRRRSETQKTSEKRSTGAVLRRRHSHNYGDEQNREASVVTRIFNAQ